MTDHVFGGAETIPDNVILHSVLLSRPSLKRATLAWGAVQRMYHNTTRHRSTALTKLSYWDDNAAGYSFWSSKDLMRWGVPETIFKLLKASYAKQGNGDTFLHLVLRGTAVSL